MPFSSHRSSHKNSLDLLLSDWAYAPDEVLARKSVGNDGRELLQLRIDLGVLQLETSGRPDGQRPHGFDTYYDYVLSQAFEQGEDFVLLPEHCKEIDREFVQYYHRRIAWLAIKEFESAVSDADHTLALMDFCTAHSPGEEWIEMHEPYRPFVLFHRTQAESMSALELSEPVQAVKALDEGVQSIRHVIQQLNDHERENYPHAVDDVGDGRPTEEMDDFVLKLLELRETITLQYQIAPTLDEQLAEAVSKEQFELAAHLRDQIAKKQKSS